MDIEAIKSFAYGADGAAFHLNFIALQINLLVWVVSSAGAFFLMQVPHIWSTGTNYFLRFEWMATSPWFTNSKPRKESIIKNLFGINMFDDGFHFFGNMPRVHMTVLLWVFYGWQFGLGMFFAWAIVWELFRKIFTVKRKG